MDNSKNTKPFYDDKGNEIGRTDKRGVTRYYDTPEARKYFTEKTGHIFKEV